MAEVASVGIPSIFGLTGAKTAFQDEGILLGDAQVINFIGDGVVATLAAGVLTVQVDGGATVDLVTTLEVVTETDTTHGVAASVIFELGTVFGQALAEKAGLSSPAFTDTPTAPTKSLEDSTTALATTAFVHTITDPFVDELANKAPIVDGLVPAIYLPSFVDDVLEFADLSSFPAVGEAGKIYIAIDTALDYRWTGSVYSVIGQTPDVVGIGANVFVRYDESQSLTTPQKAQVKANIGLSDSDGLAEGVTNKYFTEGRVLASLLTGISFLTNAAVVATDSILVAIGKLQKQVSEKEPTLPAATGTTKFLREDRTFQTLPVSREIGGNGGNTLSATAVAINCTGCTISGANTTLTNCYGVNVAIPNVIGEGSLIAPYNFTLKMSLVGTTINAATGTLTADGTTLSVTNAPRANYPASDNNKECEAIHKLRIMAWRDFSSGERQWLVIAERIIKVATTGAANVHDCTVAIIGTDKTNSAGLSVTAFAANGATSALNIGVAITGGLTGIMLYKAEIESTYIPHT